MKPTHNAILLMIVVILVELAKVKLQNIATY